MERQALVVRGVVQGVGFRPFVHGLASRLRLQGFVKNRAGAVLIEIEGDSAAVEQFVRELHRHPPPQARIDELARSPLPLQRVTGFRIEASDGDAESDVFISPDIGTCDDCLAELFHPADRRYRYPFLNCSNCGPRLTIVEQAPYDRERTTMAAFAMCEACRAEYDDPADRRFHAQPVACPVCGPRLTLHMASSRDLAFSPSGDAVRDFCEAIRRGRIGAVKGLGGFHLVCDAGNQEVVSELRRRKLRDQKPLAIMVADLAIARRLCHVGELEQTLLTSPSRPIVLLRKRRDKAPFAPNVCEAVAPGNPYLGVMLPYTPLHHLLLDGVGGLPLVMTSGNVVDEPIAYEDQEAVERLSGLADIFLLHDRPIRVRCDDSVTRVVEGAELPVRRSRGYAPMPIRLPRSLDCPVLAVGGQFKATFALGRERQAFLSHHLGDLDHLAAYRAFEKDVDLYEQALGIQPRWVVHDLHPDYAATAYARRRAEREGLELLATQHHHAHIASCMAEHALDEPVIGVAWDGTGFGTDGAIWGGEFLVADYAGFVRAAHLRYVRLPGGDQAIRQPWRSGAAQLYDAGCDLELLSRGDRTADSAPTRSQMRTVTQMIDRGFQSPLISSAGRLFDAVAAIAGVRCAVQYEGQAAMELEWLATHAADESGYPFEILETSPYQIDTRPLIQAIVCDVRAGRDAARIARRFHATLVEIVTEMCGRIRGQTGLNRVVLSGGVFLNALLTRQVARRLTTAGFRVHRHRRVPPSDGGLSLGQLAIAARHLELGRQPGLGEAEPVSLSIAGQWCTKSRPGDA